LVDWTNAVVLVVEGRSRQGTPVGQQREFCDDGAPNVEREYSDKSELLRPSSEDPVLADQDSTDRR
jgi:hypothetical protein